MSIKSEFDDRLRAPGLAYAIKKLRLTCIRVQDESVEGAIVEVLETIRSLEDDLLQSEIAEHFYQKKSKRVLIGDLL